MALNRKDREVLRKLAEEYMEQASLAVHSETINLWKSLNRSEMERPMVCIDQLPWNELNDSGELTCSVSDPFWRDFELDLRKTLYKWKHFPVDMVLEPYLTIPRVFSNSRFGLEADQEFLRLDAHTTAPARHFNRVLKTEEDLEKIRPMEIIVDDQRSVRYFEEAQDLFRGVAPIVQSHGFQFHLGVWDNLSEFIGMEDVYYEFIDRPDYLHACMERLTDSVIHGIKMVNDQSFSNDISPTCHCSYIYDDDLLPGPNRGKGPLTENSWAFGLAQLFTAVSPEVFGEFEIPYISRMAEHFGSIYYGCCDKMDDRLDLVKTIPNVRKVSCSPWSHRREFAEKIGTELVMSNKPTPATLAGDHVDWSDVRKDLELTVELARSNNVNLELILKDISTIRRDPSRLTGWADLAMEVVRNF